MYFCILISSQTNPKLQETDVDPQRLAEVLMAADAVQELRQQCLKRGAAGIKGLGRQETYPSIKNHLQLVICEYMNLCFHRKTEVMSLLF